MGEEVFIPSKDTFKGYSTSSKLDTLFDVSVATLLNQGKLNGKVRKLENQKWFNRGISAGSGFASGLAAVLTAVKLKFF